MTNNNSDNNPVGANHRLEKNLNEPVADKILDTSGLTCPLPVLKTQRHLKLLLKNQILKVIATDRLTEKDIPIFCQEQGHQLLLSLTQEIQNQMRFLFYIQKLKD